MTDLEQWQAFAARVSLRLPFRADVLVDLDERDKEPRRVRVAVELHVPDRDTRDPITVRTSRHAVWTSEADAIELIFDLLDIALRHEIRESVRLDGRLACDTHAPS